MNTPNFIQRQLQPVGPKINADAALKAALNLAPHLDTPSCLEFFAPQYATTPGATLFRGSSRQPIVPEPLAIFSQLHLSIEDIPDHWLPAYSEWMRRMQQAAEFSMLSLKAECGAGELTTQNPVVAGMLLYLSSSNVDPAVRESWMEVALQSPVGSWLAGEGLHRSDERQRILDAVQSDSRLAWAVSQISGFGRQAAKRTQAHLNLYGGLIAAAGGTTDEVEQWLRLTTLAGCERPEAAAAALILQPTADKRDRACWLTTLQNKSAARAAYEVVRWAKYTWPAKEWGQLKELLRPHATSHSQWLYHWFRDIEPEVASSVLGSEKIDPLWGAELLDAIPTADDFAFRFQLGERLNTAAIIAPHLFSGG